MFVEMENSRWLNVASPAPITEITAVKVIRNQPPKPWKIKVWGVHGGCLTYSYALESEALFGIARIFSAAGATDLATRITGQARIA